MEWGKRPIQLALFLRLNGLQRIRIRREYYTGAYPSKLTASAAKRKDAAYHARGFI